MDVSAIIETAVIVGVLLLALPFPIALVASAIAWAVAGFVAVESLWASAEDDEARPDGRSRPSA